MATLSAVGMRNTEWTRNDLGTLDWYCVKIPTFLHIIATLAATLGLTELAPPFWTALVLCIALFINDRTIFFVYSSLLLMTLGFLSPLILANLPIALKIPPNGSEYDHGLLLSLYWFIGIFSVYISSANLLTKQCLTDVKIGKTDVVTFLAGAVLLLFSTLMVQGGTLVDGTYREVTEDRYGFIEFASLITLVGFCSSRTNRARKVLLACALVYIASAFLTGLRLRFISASIVTFCCFFGLRIHWKWKLAGLGGATLLFILGIVRATGFSGASLQDVFSLETQFIRGALVSTPGGAFQTSKFHAYYIEHVASKDGYPGLSFLLADITSAFVTRGALPDALEIKARSTEYFNLPGGGILPGYFFAYTGLLGAIILSVLFTYLFIQVLRQKAIHAFPYQVLLAAYAPRLLLYDWTIAFKMMFYFFMLKSILSFLAVASGNAARPLVKPDYRKSFE